LAQLTELERIAGALREAALDGSPAVLATVVGCEGSTYRRVGARMLLCAERNVGAISGGCLEVDVLARQERLHTRGRAEIVHYDARAANDPIFGFGLGCHGRVELLLEPLSGAALHSASDCFTRALAAKTAALATVVSTSAPARFALGERLLIDAQGSPIAGSLTAARLGAGFDALLTDAARVLESSGCERRGHRAGEATFELLWERIEPAPRLTLCGGGADAIPVVGFAAQLGWSVSVLEHRSAFADAARFPGAEACVLIPDGRVAKALEATAPDAVVVMSHHFERDLDYLAAALSTPVSYIGILGPRARSERLLAELTARGLGVQAAARARVHAPIGLDLGADTPEEIAFAIVAEVLAVWRGRRGASLRERRGPIHTRKS
jgi:xanthine/CO dehydrogenase XdhC/CoxF family maturation factor